MKLLLALLGLLQLLSRAQSSWFKKHDHYIKRDSCMYAFNTSSTLAHKSPAELNNTALIYYQLDGVNDTVRYIWSLVGAPTLYMSVVPADDEDNDNCTISARRLTSSWEEFVNNQSNGSLPVPGFGGEFEFSLVFNRLVEFRDTKYKASKRFNTNNVDSVNDTYRPVNLSELNWTLKGHQLTARNTSHNASKFSWTVELYTPTKPGRVGRFPKTLYSENSTVFDFVFKNFHYEISGNKDVKYGRLVLELLMVHGPLSTGNLSKKFSRDDEYTPSVFLTYNQLFGGGGDVSGGFLQWKPISYLGSKRKSTQSQQAISRNGQIPVNIHNMSQGLVTALYDDEDNVGDIKTVYIVFGTEGDDNNGNPTYVSWTGMLGFGKPPQDQISLTVIITICVGLGVPAILIAFGGIFIIIRRKPWKKLFNSNASKGYTKLDINDSGSK